MITPFNNGTWHKAGRGGETFQFPGTPTDDEIREYVNARCPNHAGFNVERQPAHFSMGMDQWVDGITNVRVTTWEP